MKAGVILFTNPKPVAVVDRFTQTRIGAFLQRRFAEQFTKPSQTVFLLLAMGFLLSFGSAHGGELPVGDPARA